MQLFDRLAKGDDKVCALAEYAAYVLYKEQGAAIEFVAPADGLPATPLLVGAVDKAPHPEAAKLFVDWAMSNRGQAFYQEQPAPDLRLGAQRMRRRCRAARRLSDFKLLYPDRLWTISASARQVQQGMERHARLL